VSARRADVFAVLACAALGFGATRAIAARHARPAPSSNAAPADVTAAPAARSTPRVEAAVGLSPEDVRVALERSRAIAAAPRAPAVPSRREALAPVFGGDELEQALLTLAAGGATMADGPALREVLRRDPRASLAAIESVMARLPDPATGTGPAHEILLRVAVATLGLDAPTRLDLLRRELTHTEAEDGRPHRPVAALALVLDSEPADRALALYRASLARQTDPEIRNELALTYASTYPEPGQDIGPNDGKRQ
jgi:hypothetical protein